MIPEVPILDGMDGVSASIGRYRMNRHPRHTGWGIAPSAHPGSSPAQPPTPPLHHTEFWLVHVSTKTTKFGPCADSGQPCFLFHPIKPGKLGAAGSDIPSRSPCILVWLHKNTPVRYMEHLRLFCRSPTHKFTWPSTSISVNDIQFEVYLYGVYHK